MNYVYDILLNFNDEERIVEFYEWTEKDIYEYIEKIPIFRINSNTMHDICTKKIKVYNDFLTIIKGKTISPQNKKDLKYAVIFSDANKVIAIEFNNKGLEICKSGLLLDEEEEVIDEIYELPLTKISYEIIKENDIDYFITREEKFKKNYLLNELNDLSKKCNHSKFNYLYLECYPDDSLSFTERIDKMRNDINNNHNFNYNELYEIIRLTYTKK